MSQGEDIIENYLLDRQIEYQREFEFSKYNFRLDFLCRYEGKFVAIEYHGQQHYTDGIFSRPLNKQQDRDNYMRDFCSGQKLHLIELDSRKYTHIVSQYKNHRSRNNKYVYEMLSDKIFEDLDEQFYALAAIIDLSSPDDSSSLYTYKTAYISEVDDEELDALLEWAAQ